MNGLGYTGYAATHKGVILMAFCTKKMVNTRFTTHIYLTELI